MSPSLVLLPLLSLPLACKNAFFCGQIKDRLEFNGLLARTAGLQAFFGLLALISLLGMS